MKRSESLLALSFFLACAAFTFSLAVCAQAQTVTTLASFNGTDGSGPFAPVIQATDGNFYGTTTEGGNIRGGGTLFQVTPTGTLTDTYVFCSQAKCADGSTPLSAPVLGGDGNLYGVVGAGGNGNSGVFYKVVPGGNLTILYSFCPASPCTDGQGPNGIIQAGDGNFYGTTAGGGNSAGGGTIFSISPAGKIKLLYSFCSLANCADGQNPFYPPIMGSDGNFYGVTYFGGTLGGGVLYELTPAGSYKVLYNFCSAYSSTCNISEPFLIVRDFKGNFFGTTAYGGNNKSGTVFEITSTGQPVILHSFAAGNGPTWPYTGLTLANDGNVYGVSGGGVDNGGLIFAISPAGGYKELHVFLIDDHGSEPVGPLFQGTDGNFYGTTTYGTGNSAGSVFRFSNGLSPLVETAPGTGKVGQSVIILGNGLTGSTSVTFNGVAAEFTVESDTYIKATVPTGATTGTVSVVTPSGTLNSNPQFVVTH